MNAEPPTARMQMEDQLRRPGYRKRSPTDGARSNVLEPKYIVYEDGVISVALHVASSDDDENDLLQVAIKWVAPRPMKYKDGTTRETTNLMGGETPWFLLPHTFGAAIGKKLAEQQMAGLPGFNDDGFNRLVRWLIEMEHLDDAMCY